MKAQYLLASASTVAVAGAAGVAGAADLPYKAAAAPVFTASWTGFYFGVNAGVVTHYNTVQDLNNWTDINYVNNIQSKNTSAAFGGQAGYNLQDGNFLWGIEADINWSGARGDKTITGCPTCGGGPMLSMIHSGLDWFSTIRGRAGLV